MKVLLDTRSFLWFIEGSSKLSTVARSHIENPDNERFLSVASLWEIAIKAGMGRISIAMTMDELIQHEVLGNAITILAIGGRHLEILRQLPFHHRDPFDRLIIAQSLSEGLSIVGNDADFGSYSVSLMW
jgi:PIN domain nuclease of toxin-antitoxin system